MRLQNTVASLAIIVVMGAAACAPAVPQPSTGSVAPFTASPSAAPPAPATPDLSVRPLAWFAPLPPQLPMVPGRRFTGSDDFMDLFLPGAAWAEATTHVQVLKLYGGWTPDFISDAELRGIVDDIRRRRMALAVEAGPLTATDCGAGIEGFAGREEGRRIVAQLERVGASLDFLAMDEPLYYAQLADVPNACHWSPERVADEVADYLSVIRQAFPHVRMGDIEPLIAPLDVTTIEPWLSAYERAVGEPLAFLHLDINFARAGWERTALDIIRLARTRGVPAGVIYTGAGEATTDLEWVQIAGERVKRLETFADGAPDHVVFQSWVDHPDRVLPETDPTTFTGLIRSYFKDRAALGYLRAGPGANLALDADVMASKSDERSARAANDAELNTWWGAGDFAPQWIEFDLGGGQAVAAVRLLTDQGALVGRTVHHILGRGPATDGELSLLAEIDRSTADLEWLEWQPDVPLTGIDVIRVETIESPSWIGWREIQIIAAR